MRGIRRGQGPRASRILQPSRLIICTSEKKLTILTNYKFTYESSTKFLGSGQNAISIQTCSCSRAFKKVRISYCFYQMSSYLTFLSLLSPIPCRDDIATVAQRNFSKTGVAVEVGVFRGQFSVKNLHHWQGKYFQVDAWTYRPGDPSDLNYKDNATNEHNKDAAWKAVVKHQDRVKQIQEISTEAALQFKDHEIDWLYIDALHTKKALYNDLKAWWNKVRPGGLISGDDYGDKDDTRLIKADRWSKMFGTVARNPSNKWGVISALEQFTAEKGVILHVTWSHDCYKWPAWYFVKPFDEASTLAK